MRPTPWPNGRMGCSSFASAATPGSLSSRWRITGRESRPGSGRASSSRSSARRGRAGTDSGCGSPRRSLACTAGSWLPSPARKGPCSGSRFRSRRPLRRRPSPERPERASLRRARLGLRRRDLLLLRSMTAIDAIAQLLAGAEEDPALRLDRDHLSGLGVTAVVSLVVLDVERAKTANFDVVALAERRLHRLEDRLDGQLSLLLRELALGHQNGD